jgi:hypothetical protein
VALAHQGLEVVAQAVLQHHLQLELVLGEEVVVVQLCQVEIHFKIWDMVVQIEQILAVLVTIPAILVLDMGQVVEALLQ